MAMLSSYTTLPMSRPPAPPAPALLGMGKSSSPAAALLQLRKEAAAPSSSLLVARRPGGPLSAASRAIAMRKISTRAHEYNIQPSVLVHPRPSEALPGVWTITEDVNFITLRLNVEKTTKDDLEVATTEDQVLLVIRYKKKQGDGGGKGGRADDDSLVARSLDVRLLMPPGCDDKKVNATLLSNGWLEITVTKPATKQGSNSNMITISSPSQPE